MRIVFENATERANVLATLQRLRDTISERSHSTAEDKNLSKAIGLVLATPTAEELNDYRQ